MRCRVGDMALTRSGALVEILAWKGVNPHHGELDTWLVKLLSGSSVLDGPNKGERLNPGSKAYAQDRNLTPLRGDPDAIDESTEAPTKMKEPA